MLRKTIAGQHDNHVVFEQSRLEDGIMQQLKSNMVPAAARADFND